MATQPQIEQGNNMTETPVNASGITVHLIAGDHLDAGNVRDFKLAAAPLLKPGAKLVFDMSGLKFVDSSGLGALLSSLRQLGAQGGELKLCGVTRPVRAMFELVRMHKVLDIYNTAEEAIRAYGAKA
jgi:anti-sigma B factor antagonist